MIEQFSGNGEVFKDEENIGEVNYRLYVYQAIIEGEEGLRNVIGKIDSEKTFGLFDKDNLILKLEDGRNIKFFVHNLEGDIQCSGGFFE